MEIRFTAKADADLIDCYLYGVTIFGMEQAEHYEHELRHILSLIAENPRIAPEHTEYKPPVRIHHHGKHYIIYIIQEGYVLIIRLLREEVNLRQHL